MPEQLPITVDEWSDDGKRFIRHHARLASEVIGFVTFDAVVKDNPTLYLTLRHGALVLRDHKPVPWQEAVKGRG